MQVRGRHKARRGRASALRALLALFVTIVLTGCSGGVVLEPTEGPVLEARKVAKAAVIDQSVVTLHPGNPSEVALESSQLFFESAQIVILASSSERSAITRAASVAVTLGAPLLLTAPPGQNIAGQDVTDPESDSNVVVPNSGSLNTELLRLGTRAILTVGEVSLHQLDTTSLVVKPVPETDAELGAILGTEITTVPSPPTSDAVKAIAELGVGQVYAARDLGPSPPPYGTVPATLPAERNDETIVIAEKTTDYLAGVATARAAGAKVFVDAEPASLSSVVSYVSGHAAHPVVGIGEAFHERAPFQRMVKTLRGGAALPSGAQSVFRADGKDLTVVTLDAAEAMKQRGVDTAGDVIAVAEQHAAEIGAAWGVPTIAGVDIDPAAMRASDVAFWVSETADAGQYLLLRVSPSMSGHALVNTYSEALRHPHVGMRLAVAHPEALAAADLVTPLAGLTQRDGLPQKLLVMDVGSKVDMAAAEHGPGTTVPLAVAYAFENGRRAQWQDAQDALAPGSTWGVLVVKEAAKGKNATAKYPAPESIMGMDEVRLVTLR